ncbi:MAG: DUF1573 domain-containing protein [Gelidibacter sp.]
MKRFCYFLILIIIISCKKKFEYSEIEINPQTVLIENAKINQTIKINIALKNKSSNDLKILGIKPSCNCTIPQNNEFIISKYSSDTLKINYTPTELGKHLENITIKSNTNPPFTNIKIEAFVIE